MVRKINRPMTYSDAGVNIERGNALIERIKHLIRSTDRSGSMGSIGGFGGLFDLSSLDYKQPVLVAGTDGVGTKLKLAIETHKHNTIGIDLVAMCVNDLLAHGAEPLFFLDYYASGKLEIDIAESVIKSITTGCHIAGCALIGGETAEMPGVYHGVDYDLAGFCVGVAEKDEIINGSSIKPGDAIIAIASSGAHSNGYTLIRKILAISETKLSYRLGQHTLAELLLEPTRIYVNPVLALQRQQKIKGIAHITGGGLIENIPRFLPDDVDAHIDCSSWQWPELFSWLQKKGNIDALEMYTTFNCGVGLVLVVSENECGKAIAFLADQGETVWRLGSITQHCQSGPRVKLA